MAYDEGSLSAKNQLHQFRRFDRTTACGRQTPAISYTALGKKTEIEAQCGVVTICVPREAGH